MHQYKSNRSRWSRRLPRRGSLVFPVGLALAVTAAPISAQDSPVLVGRVVEAGTGSPLSGVMVGVPDEDLHVLTAEDGAIALPGLEPGVHRVVIDLLGYQPVDRFLTIHGDQPTIFALNVQPISLEAIEVQVERIDTRRQHVGTASFVYTNRDLEARLQDADTFLRGRGQLRPVTCELAHGCFMNRGQMIAGSVFVDDHRAAGGFEYLSGIPPELIARIETYPACGMVRLYTKRHLERLAKVGAQLLPFECYRQRVLR